MIAIVTDKGSLADLRFRLLNSEIGNDQKKNQKKENCQKGFRLLNSEIGNDRIKYQNGIRMGVTSIK